jgi:AcrR family transcriptional regulator
MARVSTAKAQTRPKAKRAPAGAPAKAKRAGSKSRARTKAEQRAETSEKILDAAEELFSKRGIYGVALRDVAKYVGIHESLVKYYFKDKNNLAYEVTTRRAHVTINRRMKALEDYERKSNGKPTVVGALRAFIDTDLDLYYEGGEGWMNYAALGAQISNTPEGAALMASQFDPVVLKLISVLKKALPEYSDEEIFWGYDFVTGALMHALGRTGRIDRLSGGLCRSDDFPAVKQRFAKFMAAGFKALKDT